MLTIEKVSQKTKDRIIGLLTQEVDFESVQACIMGLASENLGVLTFEDGLGKFPEISADATANEKQYAALAMTIFGLHHGKQVISETLVDFGLSEDSETAVRMLAELPEIVARTVRDFLPKVTN